MNQDMVLMKPIEPPPECGLTEELEAILSDSLSAYVVRELREPASLYQQRAYALDVIEGIISDWVRQMRHLGQKKPDPEVSSVRLARIYPYGSYYLDVHVPGSDIDSVVVLPCYISSDNFLQQMPLIFQQDKRCSHTNAVIASKHKLLTIKFNEIEFDLRPLILGEDFVPREINFLDENFFKNCAQSMRDTIAAVASNMWIKQEVQPVYQQFQIIVRFLKKAITEAGISGNKYGYFGGVNLALLSCFLMKKMGLERIGVWSYLYNFFYVFSRYDYSNPIIPNPETVYVSPTQSSGGQSPPMQLITPVKPEQNSTAKVTESGRRVIKQVFRLCERNMTVLMELASQSYGKPHFALFQKLNVCQLIFMQLHEKAAAPLKQEFFSDPDFKAGYLYIQLSYSDLEPLQAAQSKLEPMLVYLFNTLENIAKEAVSGFANIDYFRPWPQWFSQDEFSAESDGARHSRTIFIAICKLKGDKKWLIQQLKDAISAFKAQMQSRFQQDDSAAQIIISRMAIAIKGGKELRERLLFK